ncbi:hypothetical protein FRC02_004902 [Tulasnella sp. 418]|nr:hypothetical protein FRC02_004902 [Tulasnella sp. 418]
MVSWKSLLAAVPFIGAALAQSSQYCDPDNHICFENYVDPIYGSEIGFVFPSSTSSTEFIGQWKIPVTGKWFGITLGPGMNRNLLLVAWPNGNNIVYSARVAENYVQPTVVTGPIVTTLGFSQSSTHWKWTFRCQGCTTWSFQGIDGAIVQDSISVFGWALSTTAVDQPSNAASTFEEHDAFNLWGHNVANAHSSSYSDYLSGSGSSGTATATSTVTSTTSVQTIAPTPYDYIVVGGGTAGLVVADRLSEAGKKVLLIEKGGPSTWETGGRDQPNWLKGTELTRFDTPGLFEAMFSSNNPYWWCKDITVFAGCLLGGGSSINGMLYYYPPDSEFSQAQGWPAGWQTPNTARDKLKAKLPSTDVPSPDGKRYLDQVYDVVKTLLNSKGYNPATINDNADWKDSVYGHPAYNFVGGKRSGPLTYLRSSKTRANFNVMTYTNVIGVVRNGAAVTGVRINNTAYGGNGIVPLTTKGRVVLSAGAFGSPRILFQSGIGPSDMINLVKNDATYGPNLPPQASWINLPVGSYVSDNPSINLVFTHPSVDSYDNWQPIWDSPRTADANQYKSSQSGMFAASSPRINFWKAYNGPDNKTRYMQGTARPGAASIETSQSYNASNIFTITVYLSQGITSRGRIGIDAAMRGVPIVEPWFQDTKDKTVLLNGINDILGSMSAVPNLKLITPDLTKITVQSYVDNYGTGSMNSNHWVGSCKIGTSSSSSVVDANTKVWNTNNLFVVDASIIPGQPMSNPHASIMVVAEHAAAKILALAGGA